MARLAIASGSPEPLGVSVWDDGINIAVVSRNADAVWFCLFDEAGEREVARFALPSRTGDVWCGFIAGVKPAARYGLRADGPYGPETGQRFDPAKLLLDPYAKAIDRAFVLHDAMSAPRPAEIDTASVMPKAIVTAPAAPVTAAPRRPGFIYEVGVKAFTKLHPEVPMALRGTLAGLAHPKAVEHLVRLGVDTVELMPIAAWIDERHLPPLGLTNAWGYNPVGFMAADPRIVPGGIGEVRAAVAALGAAGIGVILDVVFNHTGESDVQGPTLSLRGLDNALYYRHAADGTLANDAGTGNVLAADRPEVVRLITDAMRHWAGTGVAGFRLDLASVLGRSGDGFARDAPLFVAIEADPALSHLTIIAEPWDVGLGGYQLGNFPARWSEWNDWYRDDVRRFWRGDAGTLGTLATRLAGSADVFGMRRPSAGVNFLAAHDGFTLADLVAYRHKHNAANGEDNRDGGNADFSWNNGVEGVTADAPVVAARKRDVRALLATLFVSRGLPMLTASDEFGRTQGGNNNAYAQDNATTWLNWALADYELAAFTARLAAVRKAHPSLSADVFLTGRGEPLPDAMWLASEGGGMTPERWEDGRRVVGLVLTTGGDRTAVWVNGGDEVQGWLPAPRAEKAWRLEASSAEGDAAPVPGAKSFAVPARSVLVFAEG
ncbi:MAG TPA: glycogen debranching protein GlgX [Opitutus sp.]|nr:glycogen debranching protein GlgX [Opitutus sp.]HVY19690.1 glycogen debranching protein GlgX [Bauldia sp.]